MKIFAHNQDRQNNQNKRGFALLFAVLVSSVLLSIGLSIFNLTIKELALSSSGRESQFSFYAADTGAECALYWDIKGTSVFATSSSDGDPSPAHPDCVDSAGQAAQDITQSSYSVQKNTSSGVTQFSLNIPSLNPTSCAIVTVTKTVTGGIVATNIDSRGYNTACSDTTNPNRVERALRVNY